MHFFANYNNNEWMNNKTNNLTGIQSNKIDSMCFYCFSWQFMCVWCVWGWNSFTIRPSFPRKSDCLTPAMPLWLSSNTSLHGFMGYAIYGYYQSNLLYFLSLLFWYGDWLMSSILSNQFLFIKMKIFSRFYSWTMKHLHSTKLNDGLEYMYK